MKKLLLIITIAILCGAVWTAQAQVQKTFLKVIYVDLVTVEINVYDPDLAMWIDVEVEQYTVLTDDFPIEGGIVQIRNNEVTVVFADSVEQNRSYLFDDVISMEFEQRTVQGIKEMETIKFSAYFVGDVLHLSSEQMLGNVSIYSITGALVAGINNAGNTAQINLPGLSKGVYIVRAGTSSVKTIK
ncbi:T9SS type A sorting domain-containing protein [Bacteroidales bacterium OttesenSCG-928-B11]|nr:T9SS type A sorting domain-containing protein [Bacteroidales bacterium OttesenSCG-928-B11]